MDKTLDLDQLKVVYLKSLLKKRGISSDGYKRTELLELAKRALEYYNEKEPYDEIFKSD